MAAWMLSAIVAAAAFGVAALLAERALSVLGRPARWPWLGALLVSAAWPFVAAALRAGRGRGGGDVALPAAPAPDGTVLWSAPPAGSAALPDLLLLGGWVVVSSLILVVLHLSVETLKADRRRWRTHRVGGEPVFVSGRLGPAVVGTRRPSIVLPRWVLEMDEALQRMIVLHEREHVRAGDTRLLAAGLLTVVVLPWCLPLWWQLHRLRLAIETDCDARVLRTGTPAREYAEVLVAVARRRSVGPTPLVALSPTGRELRRRIRRIVAGPVGEHRALAASLLSGAVAILALGTAVVPVADRPSLGALASQLRVERLAATGGALPGDPGQERLAAAIGAHHAAAVAAGLPPESVVWFVADRSGAVRHTGTERGSEAEVEARVRSRFGRQLSDLGFAWSDVPAAGGATVLWMLAR